MAEVKTEVTLKRIKEIAYQIVEHSHPQKILLFGSYAHGTATLDSDMDLLAHIKSDFNVARFNQFLRRHDNAFQRCTDSPIPRNGFSCGAGAF